MKCSAEKQAALTAEDLRLILSYDPYTGELRWLRSKFKARVGQVAGCVWSSGYRVININGHQYLAHRLAWLYVHGVWPHRNIDHRDGVRSNNRIANLRMATEGENAQNQRVAHPRNRGGVLGVSWCADRQSWRAMLMVNGKNHYLGRFREQEDAKQAYLAAKAAMHPFQTIVPTGAAA